MDKFIIDVYNSIDVGFNQKDVELLSDYLEENINNFKNFSKYDNFLIDFPGVTLQVDQNYNYDNVNAYYETIYPELHTLVDDTDSLKDCIINFVTATQRIEVIDANIKLTQNIKKIDFINCIMSDGIFESCNIVNTEVTNCQLLKSRIHGCDVRGTKVLNCEVESSELHDCFFMGGYLNGDMFGGVWRNGNLGPYGNLSSDTKIVSDTDNFFDTKYDDEPNGKKDKGVMKNYKI
jgi:hypothetical protein